MAIEYVAPGLRWVVALRLMLAAGWTIGMVMLDAEFSDLLGLAIAAVAFGVLAYFTEIRERIPRGVVRPLPDAPVEVQSFDLRDVVKRVVIWLPVLVAIVWLLGGEDGALVVTGHFIGAAVAAGAGLVQVARWERAHTAHLVAPVEWDSYKALFAVPHL